MNLRDLVAVASDKTNFAKVSDYVDFCVRFLEFAAHGLQAVMQLLNNPVMKSGKLLYRRINSANSSGFSIYEHLSLTGLLRSYAVIVSQNESHYRF